MKCPKCGYLGFDSGERCRNCGYDFSLVSQPGKPPLRDAPLSRGSRSRHAARTPGADRSLSGDPQGTPIDLPLFGGDAPVLPPPRAPLAVRRAAPTPARVRSRAPVPRAAPAPLLDREPGDVPPPPSAPTPRAAGGRLVQGEWASAPPWRRAAAAAIDVGLVALIDVVVLHFTLALCGLTFSDLRELPRCRWGRSS